MTLFYSIRYPLYRGAWLLLLVGLLSGCGGGFGERPFAAMSELAGRMTVVDEILIEQREQLKAVEFQTIAEDKRLVKMLELEFQDPLSEDDDTPIDPFSYRFAGALGDEDEPLFLKLERFRSGIEELNAGLKGYLDGLTQLADGELVDSSAFAELGGAVQSGTQSLLGIADPMGEKVNSQQVDLFSFMVAEVAEGYVVKKRKEHLANILEHNQPIVDRLVGHIRQAVRITADQVRAQYSVNRRLLRTQLAADEENAEWLVRQVYAYSSKVGITLDMLREVDRAYTLLGEKHAELRSYLRSNAFSIDELQNSIGRLESMYHKLENARAAME